MQSIHFSPMHSRFSPVRALCAGAVCFTLLFPQTGVAMGKAPASNAAPTLSWQAPSDAVIAEATAGHVKAKAEFAASIAPKLGGVAGLYMNVAKIPGSTAIKNAVDCLWLLRDEPDLMQARIDALLAVATKDEAEKAYQALLAFVKNVKLLAEKLDNNAGTQLFTARKKELKNAREKFAAGDYAAHALSLSIDEGKAFAATLVPAVSIAARLPVLQLNALARDEALLESLRTLLQKPEHLYLAAEVLGYTQLASPQRHALVVELASSPKTAQKKISSLKRAAPVHEAYTFAMRTELGRDIIGLPLASVIPDVPFALEMARALPLSATKTPQPQKTLTFAKQEQMTAADAAKTRSKAPRLPFLLSGERLYTLNLESGIPVFLQSPIQALGPAGPHLAEYTEETAEQFFTILTKGNNPAGSRPYLIAATCRPEELARHLGSLALVLSDRERSLYGSFEEYLWHPRKNDAAKKPYPADAKGEKLRLANILNANFFFSLAPLADEKGLARLMGPIRGVWTQSPALTDNASWLGMRYAPNKRSLGKGFSLETAPILSLDKTALEGLIKGREENAIHQWTTYLLDRHGNNGDASNSTSAEALAASVEKTRKAFAALHLLGIVSPGDKVAMTLYMENAAGKPELFTQITDIINDTRRSSAQRLLAIKQLVDKE